MFLRCFHLNRYNIYKYFSAFQKVLHSHPWNPFQFPVRTFLSLRPCYVPDFSYLSLQAGGAFTCQHLPWGASETRDVHWLWQQIQPSFPTWTCHQLQNPHVAVCESKHNLFWLFEAHMWILFPELLPEDKSEIVSSRGLLLTFITGPLAKPALCGKDTLSSSPLPHSLRLSMCGFPLCFFYKSFLQLRTVHMDYLLQITWTHWM